MCGLIAAVENERLVSLRPDPDHPLSQGRACPKGIAFTDIQNDPDRVLTPLRRRPDGEFEEVTWDDALDDIAARLSAILARHGGASVGQYIGNPAAFGYSTALWPGLFMARIGSRHLYSAGSQDINSRFVGSKLLYGANSQLPFPDLPRTDFLLMLGAHQRRPDRDRAPRRPGGRDRSAPHRNRSRPRAHRRQTRLRRLASAVHAAGDLRRRPAGLGGDRAPVHRRRGVAKPVRPLHSGIHRSLHRPARRGGPGVGP